MSRIVAVTAALAAFGFFFLGRHYPWQLALLMAAAAGALAYSAWRTYERLGRLYRDGGR